jgi:hypothetical protein
MSTYPTVRWDTADLKTIYVIETDLPLSKDDRLYDDDAFNDLLNAAKEYLEANPTYDSVDIRPFHPW